MATYTWPPISVTASSGPLQFTKNSATVTVTQDTTTPANSIPLPVEVLGTNGVAVDPATAANQATEITKLTSLDTKLPAQGQALAGASLPVVLPAAQITTLTPPTTVTVTQATGTNLHTVVDSSALPTGASTSALQTSGNSSLTSIDGKTPALGQALAASSVPVVLPAAQITTLTPPTTVTVTQATGSNLHVAVDSSALPTGAATSALQSTISGQLPSALGAKTIAASLAVNIASDQVVPTKANGKASANAPVYNDYGTTPVTTGAYVQLVASLTTAATEIEISETGGNAIYLATGAALSEVIQIVIPPGGNGRIPLSIAAGTRVSVKAVATSSSTAGSFLIINFYA